ncbi:MAG: 2-oxoacid:acceptor oxidoreductase subunit alpha [Candidatus Omnitrophota bacterium]
MMKDRIKKEKKIVEGVVIRFAGDSGDGMQLTGAQFTDTTAVVGNFLSTFPNFPAEIRAPSGTIAGVSGFQIHFASQEIQTPGDRPDVLVAMNPASLKVSLPELREGATIIANSDAFANEQDLEKAGYPANPLTDGSLSRYRLIPIPITTLNLQAVETVQGLTRAQADRCKNFFVLGVMYWVYDLPLEHTLKWNREKFAKDPALAEANERSLKGGYTYAEATEMMAVRYHVGQAQLAPGKYREVTGNEAIALGLVTAATLAGKNLFYGSYPITPASEILQELSGYKSFRVKVFQAEDEIAAVCAAIGASFAGDLGSTGTSGPGLCLKMEGINLAVMTELPLIVVDVQRGGPSTGLPTKGEQGDLLQAFGGRNSDSPLVILAPMSPADCFTIVLEAAQLAIQYMTPVIILSDGHLAFGSEPWRVPKPSELPKIKVTHRTDPEGFYPYLRDPETLARPWVLPGTPGMEHRIGGLEKADVFGTVSYDPLNHQKMMELRDKKIAGVAKVIPDIAVLGEQQGELLVVGWGSSYGAITGAVKLAQSRGLSVSSIHLRHLNPFPKNLGAVLSHFKKILVPEMNLGQLSFLLRARYLVEVMEYHKVQGKPFLIQDILEKIEEVLKQ